MIMIKIYTLAKENDDILYMPMSLLGPGGGGATCSHSFPLATSPKSHDLLIILPIMILEESPWCLSTFHSLILNII